MAIIITLQLLAMLVLGLRVMTLGDRFAKIRAQIWDLMHSLRDGDEHEEVAEWMDRRNIGYTHKPDKDET